MKHDPVLGSEGEPTEHPAAAYEDPGKPAFAKPKLRFIKPELVKEGKFTEVTSQFFGTFTP